MRMESSIKVGNNTIDIRDDNLSKSKINSYLKLYPKDRVCDKIMEKNFLYLEKPLERWEVQYMLDNQIYFLCINN
jgi:hypothetical protein